MILNALMRRKMETVKTWDDYLAIMQNLRWYRLMKLNVLV